VKPRPLGRTGLSVSPVGLGAGRIGGPGVSDADVDRLVGIALDAGVTLIDTARSYGDSEERLGRALDVQVSAFLDRPRLPELETYLVEEDKKIGTRLTVIAADGTVLADSEQDPARMENHRYRPEVYQALEGRTGHSLRHSDTVHQDMLYVALPVQKNGRVEAALRLSLFVKDIDILLGALRKNLAAAGGIILAVSLLAAFVFSRNLTRPVGELIRASRRVAAGDFDARVRPRIADEWKDLAQSFNFMTEEIKTLADALDGAPEMGGQD